MKQEEIVDDRFRMPDAMWERIEVLLPKRRRRKVGGRPPLPWRLVIDGIFYVLRTGCQWKAAPRAFGSGSSLHRTFSCWSSGDVLPTCGPWPCWSTTTWSAWNGSGNRWMEQ
jgi:transposase